MKCFSKNGVKKRDLFRSKGERKSYTKRQQLSFLALQLHFFPVLKVKGKSRGRNAYLKKSQADALAYLNSHKSNHEIPDVEIAYDTSKRWSSSQFDTIKSQVLEEYTSRNVVIFLLFFYLALEFIMIFSLLQSLSKFRQGSSEFEEHLPQFKQMVKGFTANGLNLRSSQAVRHYARLKRLSQPSRDQLRRIRKLGDFVVRKPMYDFGIKYENAANWKTKIDPYYRKTYGEIMKNAIQNEYEIFNSDETSLPLNRFNENTKEPSHFSYFFLESILISSSSLEMV